MKKLLIIAMLCSAPTIFGMDDQNPKQNSAPSLEDLQRRYKQIHLDLCTLYTEIEKDVEKRDAENPNKGLKKRLAYDQSRIAKALYTLNNIALSTTLTPEEQLVLQDQRDVFYAKDWPVSTKDGGLIRDETGRYCFAPANNALRAPSESSPQ
jgi:hypothetical protein